jgi:tetratricopeptide (TPR) repeat protein
MSQPANRPPCVASHGAVFLAACLLILAVLAAYGNSLSRPFIFDDYPAIMDNPTIRHLGSAWSPPHNGNAVDSRPLLNFSLAVNYTLGGLDVRGYHALNLAIHIFAALALFGIVRRTLLRQRLSECGRGVLTPRLAQMRGEDTPPTTAISLALVVAVLWAVHPLQTESVTCVVQRSESLMGLFYLLTLYCFVRGTERRCQVSGARYHENESEPRHTIPDSGQLSPDSCILTPGSWLVASLFFCLIGMATKEVMVSAPLMVLLYDRTFVAGTFREAWRQRWKLYLSLACTWLLLGYLVAAAGGSRGQAAGFGLGVTPWTYALTQCQAVIHYLKLSVWPHPLILDYGIKVVRHLIDVLPQALLLVLLVVATILGLWRGSALGFVGAWFFAILAPSSSVVPLVQQTAAEHRMYLPLASVIVLVVMGLYAVIGRRAWLVSVGLAVLLIGLTVRRNEDYRSALSIWTDTVAKQPDNARAHNDLGYELYKSGRLEESIAHYLEALRLEPNDASSHFNLATALLQEGQLPEAIQEFRQALQLGLDDVRVHNNFGLALVQQGRTADAIEQYEAALRLDSGSAEVRNNLGDALLQMGRLPEAGRQFEAALQIDPNSAETYNNLGTVSVRNGQMDKAVQYFREAVRLKPDYADAHYNLGAVLLHSGQMEEAIGQFEKTLQLKPDDIETHSGLGEALAKTGRLPEAIRQFEEVLRLKPGDAETMEILEKLRAIEATSTNTNH